MLPVGGVAVTNDHAVPFHVSATDGPVLDPPTARQNVVPTHDTEFRLSPVVAASVHARDHGPRRCRSTAR